MNYKKIEKTELLQMIAEKKTMRYIIAYYKISFPSLKRLLRDNSIIYKGNKKNCGRKKIELV